MKKRQNLLTLTSSMVAGLLAVSMSAPTFAEGNPCAPKAKAQSQRGTKNPCVGKNPCAARNTCAAGNPCAAGDRVDSRTLTRPAGTKPYQGNQTALLN